jgi:hypothetical protein
VVHINTVEYVSGLRFGGLDPTEEVQAVAAATGESIPGLLDQIGLALALGFETGDLSYQFCDDLVNHLFALHCDSALGPDSLFWRVFGAFDEGEFRHAGDEASVDPVDKYTRPFLNAIVEATTP